MERLDRLSIKKGVKLERIKDSYYVLDIETNGLNPNPAFFVCACIVGHNYKKSFTDIETLKIEILNSPRFTGKTIFAHNAEFDLMGIYGNIFQNIDRSAIYSGSQFICATIDKNRKTRFADSSNIFKTSVEKIGIAMGYEKGKTDERLIKGTFEGTASNDILQYCLRDCEIIYKALLDFFHFIGDVKLTIASSAMSYFRRFFLEQPIYFDREKCNEFRASYYGGRTEAFFIGECNATFWDINSLYPYIMKNIEFPNPSQLIKEVEPNLAQFNLIFKNYHGMAKVDICHNDTYFGYLPYRDKKLLFPVGNFTTTVNFPELLNAVKKGIVHINKVHYTVYSKSCIESPFKEYVDENYKLRKLTKQPFVEMYIKFLLNSLYGKFAEKIDKKQMYFETIEDGLTYINENQEMKLELKLFSKDRNDCYLVEDISDLNMQPSHSIPLFASYITSYARLELLNALETNINSTPLYSDTDSIAFAKIPNLKDSQELGEWKLESKILKKIRGLKNYDYEEDGKYIEKIKGISIKSTTKTSDNTYKQIKYYKSRQSLRLNKEAGTQYENKKTLTHIYDKRIVLKNGETKPIKL